MDNPTIKNGDSIVNWPAVIKYQGTDELVYVGSLTEWLADLDFCQANYEIGDRLIDVNGTLFSLQGMSASCAFVPLAMRICVFEFVELVRKYAVMENYCCSAKLTAKTHQQVIAMVKEINSI